MRDHRARRVIAVAAMSVLVIATGARLLFWGEIRAFWYRNYTEVRVVSGSDWFDYPVGAPDARGYFRAQRFGGSSRHLGEDWNGMGGGNSDYGERVYAIADGRVTFAHDAGGGWGNVVRITHPVKSFASVEAVYAHLSEMRVRNGNRVRRGQVIGEIGNVGGLYPAHLHFELRSKVGLPLGRGYGDRAGFLDPAAFIDKHRKRSRS